jgi:hypothetical protein
MPIQLFWDNDDKTILIQQYEGRWTVEDYYGLVDDFSVKCAEVPHTVHVIANLIGSSMPPGQMLSGIQYALKKYPPNTGVLVYVKMNRVMNMFLELARQLSPRFAQFVYAADTLEEARQLIAEKSHLVKSAK